MTRNLKALGLALLAVNALGAVTAQGASAHEFHAEFKNVISTGENLVVDKFQVGTAGVVECVKSEFESTQTGSEVSASTYKADTILVTPRYKECTFGSQPAAVNFNHCAVILDSDTTAGHPEGGEHANAEITCGSTEEKVEIHTVSCTVLVKGQTVNHAVRLENDTSSSIKVKSTARNIFMERARTTPTQPLNGCLTFPHKAAVGIYTSEHTGECFKDAGKPLEGTDITTPQGKTTEEGAAKCSIA